LKYLKFFKRAYLLKAHLIKCNSLVKVALDLPKFARMDIFQ